MEAKNTTFSVRLSPKDHETLISIAKLRNMSLAELVREFILEGIRASLEEEQIERLVEAQKQHLLAAAREMREAATNASLNQ